MGTNIKVGFHEKLNLLNKGKDFRIGLEFKFRGSSPKFGALN